MRQENLPLAVQCAGSRWPTAAAMDRARLPLDHFDIKDLALVEDAQVAGLIPLFDQLQHVRQRFAAQVHAADDFESQLGEHQPQPVFLPVAGALEIAVIHQRGDDAVRGGFVQIHCLSDLGNSPFLMLVVKAAQNLQGAFHCANIVIIGIFGHRITSRKILSTFAKHYTRACDLMVAKPSTW